MASMTSVISLLVLLLATYSYSIPVVQQFNGTAPVYPFMNNGTILENVTATYNGSIYGGLNNASNIYSQRLYTNFSNVETSTFGDLTVSPRSIGESGSGETTTYGDVTVTPRSMGDSESDETTTYGEITVTPRSLGDSESAETTTYGEITVTPRSLGDSESAETTTYGDITVTPRSIGDSSNEENTTSSDITFSPRSFFASEFSSSTPSEEENFNEFSSTTMESAAAFNQRAIHNLGDDEFTSSTAWPGHVQGEMSQNIQPSASVTKFGQYSGLIPNGQTATARYVQQGQSGSQFLTQGQRVGQPVASQQVQNAQLFVPRPTTQAWTKTQQLPQYVENNQVPVSQVSGQQPIAQVWTKTQRLPQYVETHEIPVSQVSGQQSGSQFSSQGQRFPQSVQVNRVQGTVVVSTPSQESVTGDMESSAAHAFPSTTVREFTGQQANATRRF